MEPLIISWWYLDPSILDDHIWPLGKIFQPGDCGIPHTCWSNSVFFCTVRAQSQECVFSLSAHFSISSGGQPLMKTSEERSPIPYHQMDAQWADLFLMLFICLRSGGKKSFVIKSLGSRRRERADWPTSKHSLFKELQKVLQKICPKYHISYICDI